MKRNVQIVFLFGNALYGSGARCKRIITYDHGIMTMIERTLFP